MSAHRQRLLAALSPRAWGGRRIFQHTSASCIVNVPRCPLPCYRCSVTVMFSLSPSCGLSRRLVLFLPLVLLALSAQSCSCMKKTRRCASSRGWRVAVGSCCRGLGFRMSRNLRPWARKHSTRLCLTGYTSLTSSGRIDMFACWSFLVVFFLVVCF